MKKLFLLAVICVLAISCSKNVNVEEETSQIDDGRRYVGTGIILKKEHLEKEDDFPVYEHLMMEVKMPSGDTIQIYGVNKDIYFNTKEGDSIAVKEIILTGTLLVE